MLMARPNGEERSISHFLSVYAPVNRATRGSCPPRWLPPGDTTCSQLQVQKEKGLVLWKRQREMKEREKKRRLVLPIAAANHFRWPALSHSYRVPSRRAFGHNCQRPSLKRSRDTRGGHMPRNHLRPTLRVKFRRSVKAVALNKLEKNVGRSIRLPFRYQSVGYPATCVGLVRRRRNVIATGPGW